MPALVLTATLVRRQESGAATALTSCALVATIGSNGSSRPLAKTAANRLSRKTTVAIVHRTPRNAWAISGACVARSGGGATTRSALGRGRVSTTEMPTSARIVCPTRSCVTARCDGVSAPRMGSTTLPSLVRALVRTAWTATASSVYRASLRSVRAERDLKIDASVEMMGDGLQASVPRQNPCVTTAAASTACRAGSAARAA